MSRLTCVLCLTGLLWTGDFLPAQAKPQEEEVLPGEEKRPVGRTGLFFSKPLMLGAGRENNLQVGRERISDTVTLFSPGTLDLRAAGPRGEALLEYRPQFEFFTDHRYRYLNNLSHSAMVRLVYKATPRLMLKAGDSFLATDDPSVGGGDRLLLLPRGRFRENGAYGGFSYDWTPKTNVDLRLDHIITGYQMRNRIGENLFDQTSNVATLWISHRFSLQHRLGVSYSYLWFETPERLPGGGTASFTGHANLAMLRYDYTPNRDWNVEISGGGIARGAETSYLAGAVVQRFFRYMTIAGGYHRTISLFGAAGPRAGGLSASAPAGSGLLPSTVYEAATFRMEGWANQRLSTDLIVMASRARGEVLGLKSLLGGIRVSYLLTDRVGVFGAFELHSQNRNAFLNFPISRQRYFCGLEFHITRPRPTGVQGAQRGRASGTPGGGA